MTHFCSSWRANQGNKRTAQRKSLGGDDKTIPSISARNKTCRLYFQASDKEGRPGSEGEQRENEGWRQWGEARKKERKSQKNCKKYSGMRKRVLMEKEKGTHGICLPANSFPFIHLKESWDSMALLLSLIRYTEVKKKQNLSVSLMYNCTVSVMWKCINKTTNSLFCYPISLRNLMKQKAQTFKRTQN